MFTHGETLTALQSALQAQGFDISTSALPDETAHVLTITRSGRPADVPVGASLSSRPKMVFHTEAVLTSEVSRADALPPYTITLDFTYHLPFPATFSDDHALQLAKLLRDQVTEQLADAMEWDDDEDLGLEIDCHVWNGDGEQVTVDISLSHQWAYLPEPEVPATTIQDEMDYQAQTVAAMWAVLLQDDEADDPLAPLSLLTIDEDMLS